MKLANTVNAAFVPRILGVVVFLCSALLFAQGWRAYRKIPPGERRASTEERRRTQGAALRVTVIAVVLLASAALLQKLGFIVTMPVMMFCLFCVIEKPEKRRYGLYLLFSVLTPAALFFVFYYGFSSLLPMGILTPWLSRLL